jgi:hypothetical protein
MTGLARGMRDPVRRLFRRMLLGGIAVVVLGVSALVALAARRPDEPWVYLVAPVLLTLGPAVAAAVFLAAGWVSRRLLGNRGDPEPGSAVVARLLVPWVGIALLQYLGLAWHFALWTADRALTGRWALLLMPLFAATPALLLYRSADRRRRRRSPVPVPDVPLLAFSLREATQRSRGERGAQRLDELGIHSRVRLRAGVAALSVPSADHHAARAHFAADPDLAALLLPDRPPAG